MLLTATTWDPGTEGHREFKVLSGLKTYTVAIQVNTACTCLPWLHSGHAFGLDCFDRLSTCMYYRHSGRQYSDYYLAGPVQPCGVYFD